MCQPDRGSVKPSCGVLRLTSVPESAPMFVPEDSGWDTRTPEGTDAANTCPMLPAPKALPRQWSGGATVALPCGSRNCLRLQGLPRRQAGALTRCTRLASPVLPWSNPGTAPANAPCGSCNFMSPCHLWIKFCILPPASCILRSDCCLLFRPLRWFPQRLFPSRGPGAVAPNKMLLPGQWARLAQAGMALDLRAGRVPSTTLLLCQLVAVAPGLRGGGESRPRAELARRARVVGDDIPA